MKLLLLGATGLVGSKVLSLALSSQTVSEIIAPSRQPLAAHDKLINPVAAHLEELIPTLMSYHPQAVVCALGTTREKAGSKMAFRHVDYELPLAVAPAAKSAAIETFAMLTAAGASESSLFFYYRVKGEVERDI